MDRSEVIAILEEFGYEKSKYTSDVVCKYGLPIRESAIDLKPWIALTQYKNVVFVWENGVTIHSPHGRNDTVKDLDRLREVLTLIK